MEWTALTPQASVGQSGYILDSSLAVSSRSPYLTPHDFHVLPLLSTPELLFLPRPHYSASGSLLWLQDGQHTFPEDTNMMSAHCVPCAWHKSTHLIPIRAWHVLLLFSYS